MKHLPHSLLAATLALGLSNAVAAPVNTTQTCSTSSWQITHAAPSSTNLSAPSAPTQLASPIHATSCFAGGTKNNDSGGLQDGSAPNLGYLNDGLLNGQGGLVSPTQFISASQLQDLQGQGAIDPGWVMLGRLNGKNAGELSYASVTPPGQAAFNLGDVLKYTQTVVKTDDKKFLGGTWQLQIDMDAVAMLESAGLFNRSYFDHLAFSVKASSGWAIYDFDFTQLAGFDLSRPYTLQGTWTMNCDFCNQNGNGQNISHLAVWARDPVRATQEVPEPASLALLGLGLLGLAAVRRRTR